MVSVCVLVGLLCARRARADNAAPAAPAQVLAAKPEGPCSRRLQVRAAAVGTYVRLFDIGVWGVGADVSLVGPACGKPFEMFGELRLVQDVTAAGLLLEDILGRAGAEWNLGGTGLRAGLGGGAGYLFLHRATNGSFIEIPGVEAFVRAGYDAGVRDRPFVLVDLELRAPLGAITWGAAAQLGWRF